MLPALQGTVLPNPVWESFPYDRVLQWYDGPRLRLQQNPTGQLYLAWWSDSDETVDRWIYLPVSETRLREILSGQIPSLQALSHPEQGYVFAVDIDLETDSVIKTVMTEISNLPGDAIPLPGAKLNLPVPDDILPAAKRTFRDVLNELAASAETAVAKGRSFERLVKAFLELDRAQAQRFLRVWLWSEWPGNSGRPDTGVDIVAEERDSGGLVAIQCKFYDRSQTIYLNQISTFLAACGTTDFASGLIVTASEKWGPNVEMSLDNRDKPVSRWGPDVFENSSIDWRTFKLNRPADLTRRRTKDLYDYQETALQDTLDGFEKQDRGKLIMACGAGKTFTALRIAERIAGAGRTVLFLTPSISLLSQSLIDWTNDADVPLKPFAVCSDTRAGKRRTGDEDTSPYDLTEIPSTDPDHLVSRFNLANHADKMTVVFSTYQSLDVVAKAQAMENGLPKFSLIVADEAHRTTGVSLVGKEESNFQRVHVDNFIGANKRLYMTATPRIFGDRARRQANESNLTTAITSMDDESIYGPEFHRLGFGKAIDLGILSDYKVIIFNVAQQRVAIDLNDLLSDTGNELTLDDGTRMIGCWKGLSKRSEEGLDFEADPLPAKRAVAFSNTINGSKAFKDWFPQVIETSAASTGVVSPELLRCAVRHVDGTQNALHRSDALAWLKEEPEEGVCRVLTNARCLTEGIDVPALDAILFLQPRRSDIDVVQAVGRVMRRSEGKQFGYIILPIAQAPDVSPQEAVNSSAYKTVWQVINAISAHDDRFEAKINQLALALDSSKTQNDTSPGIGKETGDGDRERVNEFQFPMLMSGSPELREAILAKVVDKYADPRYWEKWASTVYEIAQRHKARIRALLDSPDTTARATFSSFLDGIRNNLHDDITDADAIEMLSQHLITRPVFDALFADYAFTQQNSVSQAMQGTIDALAERGLEKETADLDKFYRDVRIRAQGVSNAAGKQSIISELYERFLKLALPDTANRLGIAFTPTPVVDYIVHSVEEVLQREFGSSVSDEGIHVIDPFTGTGSFIARLLQSGLIKNDDLQRKYESELHANDITLLAYYIAAINIESTYHDQTNAREYHPFEGIVLTDTFESAEEGDPMDEVLFPRNNARIERQKDLDIRVILGNPPWSATHTRKYRTIDDRIQKTYVEPSAAKLLNKLYDPYVRAIRLASDRVQGSDRGGIVAFVSNGGFIDSTAFDGFRKALAEEFHAVYCYDLRGDQRTAGERSRREGGKIFGSGSRAQVAILLLVKKPGESTGATIYYRDIGDYLSREQKLEIIDGSSITTTPWQVIAPDRYGDWINQRNDGFQILRPLVRSDSVTESDAPAPVFNISSPGLNTGRDAWCYNSSAEKLRANIRNSIEFYNEQVKEFQSTNPNGSAQERDRLARAFAVQNPQRLHWSRERYRDMANGKYYAFNHDDFTVGCYRPFFKQRVYFSPQLNNVTGRIRQIYPFADSGNLGISVANKVGSGQFYALMTNGIPDLHLAGDTIYFPMGHYKPVQALTLLPDTENPELDRVSNINPKALTQFRERYLEPAITEDDLFYYTYGVLHSQQWRETFADNLAKSEVRIPMADSTTNFHAFADAGRLLANLHVNYETVEPYPLEEIHANDRVDALPGAYRVEKMTYAGRRPNQDISRIIYNAHITLAGIPSVAQEYRLGSRSALDWLIDRYQVRTDGSNGITNDPNDWAVEHRQPRYILDLVKRVTTVSVRSVQIMRELPELPI